MTKIRAVEAFLRFTLNLPSVSPVLVTAYEPGHVFPCAAFILCERGLHWRHGAGSGDVWKKPDAAKQYGVEVIHTQIFYDAEGKELFRHVGYIGKADILAKWEELGVTLDDRPESGASSVPVPSDPLKAK